MLILDVNKVQYSYSPHSKAEHHLSPAQRYLERPQRGIPVQYFITTTFYTLLPSE